MRGSGDVLLSRKLVYFLKKIAPTQPIRFWIYCLSLAEWMDLLGQRGVWGEIAASSWGNAKCAKSKQGPRFEPNTQVAQLGGSVLSLREGGREGGRRKRRMWRREALRSWLYLPSLPPFSVVCSHLQSSLVILGHLQSSESHLGSVFGGLRARERESWRVGGCEEKEAEVVAVPLASSSSPPLCQVNNQPIPTFPPAMTTFPPASAPDQHRWGGLVS